MRDSWEVWTVPALFFERSAAESRRVGRAGSRQAFDPEWFDMITVEIVGEFTPWAWVKTTPGVLGRFSPRGCWTAPALFFERSAAESRRVGGVSSRQARTIIVSIWSFSHLIIYPFNIRTVRPEGPDWYLSFERSREALLTTFTCLQDTPGVVGMGYLVGTKNQELRIKY